MTTTMMRAAVYDTFGGPIRVCPLPVPAAPTDGVLLAVGATGVCRSDWHAWRGHDADVRRHGLPFVPGHEVSGRVVAVGAKCRMLRVGDRVAVPFILSCGACAFCRGAPERPTVCRHQAQPGFTMYGSFAEFLAVPRADRNLRRLPANVSFVQAAALGCRFTTAYRAVVQQGRLRRDQVVAVFGAGGLGLSCVMIGAAVGAARIIVVDINSQALRKATELGATHTVLTDNDEDRDAVVRRVAELTEDGQGSPLTIDAAGFASSCEAAIHCTRPGGRMIQVGLPIDDRAPPTVPMGLVAGKELELVGSHGASADTVGELLGLVSSGKLDPSRIVEAQVSLDEGVRVLQDMDRVSPLGITMITSFVDGPHSAL